MALEMGGDVKNLRMEKESESMDEGTERGEEMESMDKATTHQIPVREIGRAEQRKTRGPRGIRKIHTQSNSRKALFGRKEDDHGK